MTTPACQLRRAASIAQIGKFPDKDAKSSNPLFGLRFDDDGAGMDKHELMNMLTMHADKTFAQTRGKVRNYSDIARCQDITARRVGRLPLRCCVKHLCDEPSLPHVLMSRKP
jgi:hypothetical protein